MNTAAILMSLMLAITTTADAENKSGTILEPRQVYEDHLEKLEADTAQQRRVWHDQYLTALTNLQQRIQKAGALDNLLMVQNEACRFLVENRISEERIVEQVPELAALQRKTVQAEKNIELGKHRRVLALANSYLAGLEERKKKLTQKGQIDEAIKTNEEIDRVRESAEVTAAKRALTTAVTEPQKTVPSADAEETAGGENKILPQSLQEGLVLYYSFDRDTRDRVTDQSGKGNHAQERSQCMPKSVGRGNGLRFDGKNDKIEIHNLKGMDGGQQPLTVSVWMKCPQRMNTNPRLIHIGREVNGGFWIGSQINDKIRIGVLKGPECESKSVVFDGRFHHIVGTYDGAQERIYVDGQLENVAPAGVCLPQQVPLCLGQHFGANHSHCFYNGLMDDVLVWNRALTDKEVELLNEIQLRP